MMKAEAFSAALESEEQITNREDLQAILQTIPTSESELSYSNRGIFV